MHLRRHRPWATALLLAGAVSLAGSIAGAQPSTGAPNVTVADSLFREAQGLLAQGKTHEACEKFAESNRLDPQLGTMLNLAVCHEQEERTATAWSDYDAVVEQARRRGDTARVRYAQAHVEALEKRLSRVQLELGAGVALTDVKVDGQELGKAAWSSPLPLDPGDHVFELSAVGKVTRQVHVALARGPVTQVVHVAPLEDRSAEAATPPPVAAPLPVTEPPPAPPPSAPPPMPEAEATGGGTRRLVMYISAGVAVVGAGVGTAFGISAITRKSSDVDRYCQGSVCQPQGFAAVGPVRDAATASDVSFVVAGVGVLVGGAAFLFLPRDSSAVHVMPTVGRSSGGIGVGGAW